MKLRHTLALLCALAPPALAQTYNAPRYSSVGIGAASGSYLLDVRNGTGATQLHLSGTGADDGGYLFAVGGNALFAGAGATFNGTAFIAKNAAASLGSISSGGLALYSDTGLTAGASFTPTNRFLVDPTGNVTVGNWNATAIPVANGGTGATSASTARTNLGLGGAATLSVGTAAGTVAAGDDSRITGTVISWTPTVSCASGGTVTATSTTFALRETRAGHNKVTWSARISVSAQSSCSYLQITPPSAPLSSLGFSQTAYDESVGALMMSTITAGDAHIIFRGVGNSGTVTTDSYSSNGFYWE